MAFTLPLQKMLDELIWDQYAYQVQPADMHKAFWNFKDFVDYMRADLYGNSNGVIGTGLQISAGSGMSFNISAGRAVSLSGTKTIGLITAGTLDGNSLPTGQPATFAVTLTNGLGIAGGQSRIDAICIQYTETKYTGVNGEDRIVEGCLLTPVAGTAGVSPVAPILPDASYTQIGTVTVHSGDTSASQGTINNLARTTFYDTGTLEQQIVALQNGSVQLSPAVQQSGSINISGPLNSGNYWDVPFISTPSAPAASHVRVYYKSDGNRYVYDPVYGEQLDIPVGVPTPFAGSTLPAGCMWLDGSVFSTTTYARLAGILNGAYKTGGEAAGQDRLPDARGRGFVFPDNFGAGAAGRMASNNTIGKSGGAETHTNTQAELFAHSHTHNAHNHATTGDSHNHTQNAHTHTDTGHNHTQNAHNHTDAGHGHGVSDPGHVHNTLAEAIDAANHNFTGWFIGQNDNGQYQHPTDSQGTGVSIVAGAASINLATPTNQSNAAANANTTPTNNTAASGVVISNTTSTEGVVGSTTSFNIMHPYQVLGGAIIRY